MSYFKPGDFNVRCEKTGFKKKRSECRKQWDGRIVRKESWDRRHPQDFIRARPDRQQVEDPRPGPSDHFLEDNEVTVDDL